jgi:hypothetical protein
MITGAAAEVQRDSGQPRSPATLWFCPWWTPAAVDAETRRHEYDEIVLMTSNQEGSWLARTLHLDPIHKLQHRWGKQLTVFTAPGPNPGQ